MENQELSDMRRTALPGCGIALAWALALPALYFLSRYNYNLFHGLADGATIIVAASAFTIIWNSRQRVDNGYFLFAGIGFLFFAVLDLLHLLGNKNMGVFPEYGNLVPAFYIASRYVLSISLLIAPFFIDRKLNVAVMFAAYTAVTVVVILSILVGKTFPTCIVEGVGLTPFKVISDYVICLILLGALGLLFRNRQAFDPRVLRLITAAIALSIATGLTFTLYTDPFGITNAVGHFFQIASFWLVYLAFIETGLTRPQEILFRRLKQHEEKLTENLERLDHANAELNREVVQRKQSERVLAEQAKRLDDVNKELESFSYSVSHDLQAPLRAIKGFAQMILKTDGDRLAEESRRRFQVIVDNTEKMGQLIDDLLAFSRFGSRAVAKEEIDKAGLIREVWQELLAIHPDRKMILRMGPMTAAWGDKVLIRQVYVNLLGNAVKFTKDRVEAVIEAGSRVEGDETVHYVRDNGIGFDMRFADKLFGVFQRLHGDEEYKGTGIGLALVKRIVTRHGGRAWAEAEAGKGATFSFALPGKSK